MKGSCSGKKWSKKGKIRENLTFERCEGWACQKGTIETFFHKGWNQFFEIHYSGDYFGRIFNERKVNGYYFFFFLNLKENKKVFFFIIQYLVKRNMKINERKK